MRFCDVSFDEILSDGAGIGLALSRSRTMRFLELKDMPSVSQRKRIFKSVKALLLRRILLICSSDLDLRCNTARLESLSLPGNLLSNNSHIISTLLNESACTSHSIFSRLVRLDLSSNPLTFDVVPRLCSFIKELQYLDSLDLSSTQMSQGIREPLMKDFAQSVVSSSLRRVSLARNRLGHFAITFLKAVVSCGTSSSRTIECIDLSANLIRADDLRAMLVQPSFRVALKLVNLDMSLNCFDTEIASRALGQLTDNFSCFPLAESAACDGIQATSWADRQSLIR